MPEHPEPKVVVPGRLAKGLRVLALVIVVGGVAGLFASGALAGFSLERATELVRSFGAWGFLVYLLAFSFIQPIGVTGHVFTIAAALIWPVWIALPLALAGALGSSLVNLAFVRHVAFDWVHARIPARLLRYERWVVERGLWGVIAFRGLTFTLHPAQLLIGILRIPLPRMILGTLIGFLPHVAVDVVLGGRVAHWLAGVLGID